MFVSKPAQLKLFLRVGLLICRVWFQFSFIFLLFCHTVHSEDHYTAIEEYKHLTTNPSNLTDFTKTFPFSSFYYIFLYTQFSKGQLWLSRQSGSSTDWKNSHLISSSFILHFEDTEPQATPTLLCERVNVGLNAPTVFEYVCGVSSKERCEICKRTVVMSF